ncbi:MAG: OmpA family protein [Rhizomicrobium sp.]|jgi:outer membrane protein OmpA-like peptidoglycan-associated protein
MKHTFLFLAAASALTLAACQNAPPAELPPPIAQPAPQPSTPVAPPQQIVPAGPLTQASVGRYMDALERDLRLRLRGSGIAVARRGDDMLLTFPNTRLFASESLSPSGQGVLGSVAQVLRRYDHTQVQVNSYTDTSGSPEQNLAVSQKRAALVGDALARSGIAAARIEAHGFGEANLKVATGDHVNEPRNRRIELRITARPG